MSKIFKWVSESILTYKSIIVLSLFLALGLAAQKGIAIVVRGSVTTWEGTCNFGGWEDDEERLGFVINCGEKGTDTTYKITFIRSYLVNPGPLHCRLDLDDDIECEDRPAADKKKQ